MPTMRYRSGVLLAIVGVWIATETLKVFDSKSEREGSDRSGGFVCCWRFSPRRMATYYGSAKKVSAIPAALPGVTASQPLDTIDGLS